MRCLLVGFSCVDADHPKHSVCMSWQVMEECLCLAFPASKDAADVTTDQIPPPDDAYDAGGYGQFSKDVMCRMAKEKWPRKNGLGKMAEEKWPKQSEII